MNFSLCLLQDYGWVDVKLTIFHLKGKFRWLSEELKARLATERRLKEQADWSQKRIRVCIASSQKHKAPAIKSSIRVCLYSIFRLFIGLHPILQLWWSFIYTSTYCVDELYCMCHSQTDFIAGRVTCATVKPILLLLSLLVTQTNKLYCSSRYLCHGLTKCVPRHATCDTFKPILLRYLWHRQTNFITLLVPQSKQFYCSSRYLCHTVQPILLLVLQEGVCDEWAK